MNNRMSVLSRRLGRFAGGFSFATVALLLNPGCACRRQHERPGSIPLRWPCFGVPLRQLLFVAGARLRVGDDPREACRGEEACRGIETFGRAEACRGDETCGANETRRAGETRRADETCRGDETCGSDESCGGEGDRLRGSSRREIHHHRKAHLLTLENLSNCPAIAEALHERE